MTNERNADEGVQAHNDVKCVHGVSRYSICDVCHSPVTNVLNVFASPAAEVVAGWTDDQMIRFGNYIRSNSADSHEQRLELFREHEAMRGIPAPSRDETHPTP